ncbi:MAG: hypothetical protein QM601_11120 [Pseudoxanthomonas sp.]
MPAFEKDGYGIYWSNPAEFDIAALSRPLGARTDIEYPPPGETVESCRWVLAGYADKIDCRILMPCERSKIPMGCTKGFPAGGC